MKTNWIKLSTLVLGATVVLSSCVKTDESAEIIAMRKAKVAQMNADVAYRLADVRYRSADATIREYQAKYDSATYLTDLTQFEAQAQYQIQLAKNSLLDAQLSFEQKTKALEVEKLNNPVLGALINDYTTYYNGDGYLTSGDYVSDGIFDLQSKILTEKGSIIGLQSTKDGLAYLQKGKEIDLAAKNIELTDYKTRLQIFGDARSSGDYAKAVTAAQTLLTSAVADSVKMQLSLDNAKNSATTASNDFTAAATLYASSSDSVDTWETAYFEIIKNYDMSTDNEELDYQAMLLHQTNVTAELSRNQTLLSTWGTKYQAALTAKNNAQSAYNTANATYLAAKAIVDALVANGETPTTAQNDAVTNANTALTNAQNTLTEKEGYYNDVKDGYDDATTNYNDSKESLDDVNKDIADYNKLKGMVATEKTKLPTLKADMDAKKVLSYKSNQTRDSIDILYTNILNIAANDRSALKTLQTDRNKINDVIKAIETSINNLNKSIAQLTTEIANLKAGINTGDANKLVDEQIKISQDKIAEWEALLAKYQAKAADLKVQIDAQ